MALKERVVPGRVVELALAWEVDAAEVDPPHRANRVNFVSVCALVIS